MKKTISAMLLIVLFLLSACGTKQDDIVYETAENETIENETTIVEDTTASEINSASDDELPFIIEFEWNDELIEDDYDIEIITSGSSYLIDKSEGKAVVNIESADMDFDLTYVWLPPVGVLNNLPKCEAKIYEKGELVETLTSDTCLNVYQAPTGAVGLGICSVKDGKLTEYEGDWKELPRR